ncbi:hypothetical protein FRC02_000491 [Tulasnella sp. 418]|nr:hypothetical protein FRC02_000491 [Tulasnella sp. 418]
MSLVLETRPYISLPSLSLSTHVARVEQVTAWCISGGQIDQLLEKIPLSTAPLRYLWYIIPDELFIPLQPMKLVNYELKTLRLNNVPLKWSLTYLPLNNLTELMRFAGGPLCAKLDGNLGRMPEVETIAFVKHLSPPLPLI